MMKELVLEVAKSMPGDASIKEIFDAILVRLSALKGFKDIDEGKYTIQEDLLKELENW